MRPYKGAALMHSNKQEAAISKLLWIMLEPELLCLAVYGLGYRGKDVHLHSTGNKMHKFASLVPRHGGTDAYLHGYHLGSGLHGLGCVNADLRLHGRGGRGLHFHGRGADVQICTS